MKYYRLILFFFCLNGCFTNHSEIGDGPALPIDGTWYQSFISTNRIRIEKGQVYLLKIPKLFDAMTPVSEGDAVAYKLKEKSLGVYEGEDPHFMFSVKVQLKLKSIDSIEFGLHTYIKESVDNEIKYNNLLYDLKFVDKKSFLKMNSELLHEKSQSETIEIPFGSTMKIKRSRTLENRIEIESKDLNGEFNEIEKTPISKDMVIKFVEEKISKKIQQTETVEHEITLNGSVAQKYQLTWYDNIRTGEINTYIKGEWQAIPFKFKEWSEIQVKAVK